MSENVNYTLKRHEVALAVLPALIARHVHLDTPQHKATPGIFHTDEIDRLISDALVWGHRWCVSAGIDREVSDL